jgi:hypothetical protein
VAPLPLTNLKAEQPGVLQLTPSQGHLGGTWPKTPMIGPRDTKPLPVVDESGIDTLKLDTRKPEPAQPAVRKPAAPKPETRKPANVHTQPTVIQDSDDDVEEQARKLVRGRQRNTALGFAAVIALVLAGAAWVVMHAGPTRDLEREQKVAQGLAALKKGDAQTAATVLAVVVEQDPTAPAPQLALGAADFELDRYEDAITHLEAARALPNVSPEVHLLLAASLQGIGRGVDAVTEYQRYLEKVPDAKLAPDVKKLLTQLAHPPGR